MAIIDQKKDIYANIGALNVLNGGMPKLPSFNSISSINNNTDSSSFLIDLIKVLAGAEKIKEILIDTVVYRLPKIEVAIKDGLKQQLKEMVSCGINPEIPAWFQNGGSGVEMKVTNIDFFDMMKVNPDTLEGGLIYTDIASGVNSKDFNTYLYNTIQDPTVPKQWGNSMAGIDILETEFQETGTNDNNILKFTTSTDYSSKKLTEFNNDYIDTLTLFGEPNSIDSATFISLILEELFGSISSAIGGSGTGKSMTQVKKELEIKEILDCIINSENNNITDNFFEFDNPTLAKIDQETNDRVNGIRTLETCGNVSVQVTLKSANSANNLIVTATTKEEEFKAVTKALDDVATTQSLFVSDPIDSETVKSNFFTEIIQKLVRIFMSVIISPKFIVLFAINHQIIYGQGSSYDNAKDFIKKNTKLMKDISKIILEIILTILLKAALLILSVKLRQKFADDEIERGKIYLMRLLSSLGVPSDIMESITNL